MFSILGSAKRLCDGITRRDMLTIGALGMGGLALPDILRAPRRRRERFPPQGGDHDLSVRCTTASGHVRSEDGRTGGSAGRVPADSNRTSGNPSEHLPRLAACHGQACPSPGPSTVRPTEITTLSSVTPDARSCSSRRAVGPRSAPYCRSCKGAVRPGCPRLSVSRRMRVTLLTVRRVYQDFSVRRGEFSTER